MMDDNDPLIPFGKYKGSNASDCPVSYLDWLIGQDWLKPEFKEQIEDHLETRSDWGPDWGRMGDEDA